MTPPDAMTLPLDLSEAVSQDVPLVHGDVVVWGGPARMTFHGVHPLEEGSHQLTGNVRYNLTFRRALDKT